MKTLVLRTALVVAVLLGVGMSGLMCGRVAERGRYATAYSTYSAGPQGARAIYDLVRQAGHPTERWVEDLEGLPARSVLVALGGCLAEQRRPFSRYEAERLLEWVHAGGIVMVFGASDYLPANYPVYMRRPERECGGLGLEELLRELQAGKEPATPPEAAVEPEPVAEMSPNEGLEVWLPAVDADSEPVYLARAQEGILASLVGVPMVQPSQLASTVSAAPPTVLAGFGERSAIATLPWGAGRFVLSASASMLTNEHVLEQRGGVLFARLLDAYAPPGARVLFDEYHLGTGATRSLVRYLRQAGVGGVLLQLLFLGAVFVLRSGRRLGELEEPVAAPPGGTVSYVAATSALYSRSSDLGGVARVLLVRALDRVATHHRLRVSQPEQRGALLRAMGRPSAASATDALLQLFGEPVPTSKALFALAGRADALVAQACAPDVPLTDSHADAPLALDTARSPLDT